jgi:S1-C subfamily serine protease
MKKFIIVLAIVAVYLFIGTQALSQSQIFALGAAQTVKIVNPDNEDSGGTGFAVRTPSGKLYTMTNAHVCAITKGSFMLAKYGNKKLRLQIISISDTTDLCLLEAIPELSGLELAGRVDMYDGVYLVGHPMLQPISITAGWVRGRGFTPVGYCNVKAKLQVLPSEQVNRNNLPGFLQNLFDEVDCVRLMDSVMTNNYSLPGNSGSAVLNENGKVIGVLFAGDGRNTSLMVPLDLIHEFLVGF